MIKIKIILIKVVTFDLSVDEDNLGQILIQNLLFLFQHVFSISRRILIHK